MLAYWSSGTASGSYNQYTVTLQDRARWNAVAFSDQDGSEAEKFALSVHDYPHVGEDTIRAVRFARAVVNGRPQVVLFIARRDFVDSFYDPAPTTLELLALVQSDDGYGPVFTRVQKVRLPIRYCNAETAISRATGLPQRPGTGTKQTVDGC